MFGIEGNYDERRIGRETLPSDGVVSTVRVTDGAHPFETAVAHEDYNNGELIVVEAYDTKEQAEVGHARWVATMTAEKLPESLTEAGNAEIEQLLHKHAGGATIHVRQERA